MRKTIIVVSAAVLFSLAADKSKAAGVVVYEQDPNTKIEAFLNQKNILVVKDVYILGKVTGLYSSSGMIKAILAYEAGKKETSLKGLLVEVRKGQSDERSKTTFLDMEEIEGLSSAIASMVRLAGDRDDPENFNTEITYTTKGELSFGVYLGETEKEGFIATGGAKPLTVFMEPARLDEVKRIVDYGHTLLKMK